MENSSYFVIQLLVMCGLPSPACTLVTFSCLREEIQKFWHVVLEAWNSLISSNWDLVIFDTQSL